MLIDSHAHIDFSAFDGDRERVLARAREQGASVIINVGVDLESSRKGLEIAREYPGVFAAVGFHPNDAGNMKDGDPGRLEELARQERVVAVGEIGLDFYRKSSPQELQREVLARQLDLAARLGLPVVIHCRGAHREMEGILSAWAKARPLAGNGEIGVMHCFSGDIELARRYIELGFLISVAGPVTYPAAHDRREVAANLPLDKLLVETDSPFLAPQAHRGQRNEPAYVALVAERIAAIRGLSVETVAQATADNAIRLFRLPVPEVSIGA